MSKWERCKKRFPDRISLNDEEQDHLSILFEDYFAATEDAQRFLFAILGDAVLWSAGPSHPWRYLDDNSAVTNKVLTARFLDKEHIDNLHPLKGTGQYQGKEVKFSPARYCWVYLNNRTVHFHGTSTSETPESPTDDDTARVEEILERTETTVASAIQKLQTISRPASPTVRARTSGTHPTQTSSLPTPPMSKGKQPAPLPPRTRTPTSCPSVPKASTSQGPAQATPPQPAAPQPPPGNPPPNPPAPVAMAQQNQPRILGMVPEPYDRSPDKAIDFWNTLTNYYNINDGVYTTNTQKVSSALTHFKTGTPGGNWASDLMHTALNANPVNYGTWNDFCHNSFPSTLFFLFPSRVPTPIWYWPVRNRPDSFDSLLTRRDSW